MDLVGYVTTLGVRYPLVYTSLNKASRMWLLLKPDKSYVAYLQGEKVLAEDIVEMLDVGQQKKIGSILILKRVLQEISDFKVRCVLNCEPTAVNGVSQYTDSNDNKLYLFGMKYAYIDYKSKTGIDICLEQSQSLTLEKKALRERSEKIELDQTKTSISQFKDSTMESLELRGYNFDWLKDKDYISIQTLEEFNTVFLPDLKQALAKSKAVGERLLVTMDFESTGLNAYDVLNPDRDVATFLGVSFEDHKAYGIFLEMEHFENVPVRDVAAIVTDIFRKDIKNDRDIEILGEEFKRSDILVSGHNIMIDIRFGLTVGMDIWFDILWKIIVFEENI